MGTHGADDSVVDAVLLTPDGSRVIIGGAFQNHRRLRRRLGLSPRWTRRAAASLPYAANQVVKDYGVGRARSWR